MLVSRRPWIAQGHGAAGGQVDFAPHAHVFIGRRGIPVDEGNRQIVIGGGEDFNRENIFRAGLGGAVTLNS